MNNVVSINTHFRRFPVGAAAIHREHGWCMITAVSPSGTQRTIRWIVHVPDAMLNTDDLPIDVAPEEVLYSETIETHYADIDADELICIDPPQENAYRSQLKELTFALGLIN